MERKKLSALSQNEKFLIVHADDAGLAHSENKATIESLLKGFVNSYSIMTPCPWFYGIVNFAKKNPCFDVGVHLTLTCEWNNYKFGPVLPVNDVPSLVDENGFFHKTIELFKNNATNEDVKKELRAQIDKALRFGLNPSHLDSHMFALGSKPEFLETYMDLGEMYDLAILINKEYIDSAGLNAEKYANNGGVIVDNVFMARPSDFEKDQMESFYNNVLENLTAGLNVIIIHPAFDNDEMREITAGHVFFDSKWRQKDFDYFTSTECKSKLGKNNIKLITWEEAKNRI